MNQTAVSTANADFWNELCGSQLAKTLGVTDSSPASLKHFDDWYFDFYPYLFTHIPFAQFKGAKVLEIGLGYGTVAQRLAEAGCVYSGLDIAVGPVQMVNHRLAQNGLGGAAVQGSVLEPPFAAGTFDAIVAIGCLHHTGNLQLAIDQCHKLLKPGGQFVFMVYSAYSYRRWRMSPGATLRYWMRERSGYRGVVGSSEERQRAAYDSNSAGHAAPHTDWISITSLRRLCSGFADFRANTENIDQERPFRATPRKELLKTFWPRFAGLDVYATARK